MNQTPASQLDLITGDARIESSFSPAILLQKALEKGITAENVAGISALVDLYEKMEARSAQKAFAEAFIQLQSQMPNIQAERAVPGSNGQVRYMFAPFEDIMRQVRPLLEKHGFTVTFSSVSEEGRITQSCTLIHVGGHMRSNSFSARIGKGPPGSTETQADGAASTYAKRYALCDALNIVVQHLDNDARAEERQREFKPLAWDKIERLKELVKETKSDEKLFLKWVGVDKWDAIHEDDYAELVQALERKRKA